MQNYSFVVDEENKPLAPTKVNKAWFLIRKGRAELVSKYPMVIRLKRKIENSVGEFVMGIDDGSAHVGMAIVQKCKTKNKVVFKATMEQRQDVKKKMEVRREYRR